MSQKIKIFLGLIGLCLVSAMVASLLTAAFLVRGLFNDSIFPGRQSDPDQQLTSEATAPSFSPTVTPSVTPAPTAQATPSPAAALPSPTEDPDQDSQDPTGSQTIVTDPSGTSPANQIEEQLRVWQQPDLIANIYESIQPSVVGIFVDVAETTLSIRRTNEGSGLVMNEDGIIVTNSSVLSIAVNKQGQVFDHARIFVYLHERPRPYQASLVGRDPLTGLAVLKIDPGFLALQPAPMAQEPDLKVGQMILAMGYPDMMQESGHLFTGLISSLNRPVQLEDGTTMQMIQTDARVNLRCSGGPLINLQGEVIGLVNCGLVRPLYDTQSYALPVRTAQLVVSDLTSQGYIGGRSWLGVSVLIEESFLQLQTLYDFPSGLYITHVIDDSPAYIADLRRGDIITQINEQAVDPSMDMSFFLQSQPVGSLVRLQVYRRSDSQYHEFRVYLQEYER